VTQFKEKSYLTVVNCGARHWICGVYYFSLSNGFVFPWFCGCRM